LKNDRFVSVVGYLQTALFARRREWAEFDHPIAMFVGDGRLLLSGKFDGDLGPRRIKTPNWRFDLPL
jgi:hypothetical protein